MNVYLGWVIMQGTGSPPSYRAERMENSPWLPTKESVIQWIKDHEQYEHTERENGRAIAAVPVIHTPATRDANS